MSVPKNIITVLSACFITAEAILCILIQTVGGRANAYLSFGAILLACAFVFVFFDKGIDFALSAEALIFTVIADFFLVLLEPRQQLFGMIAFLIVQACYFGKIMLLSDSRVKNTVHFAVRGGVSIIVVAVTVFVLNDACDALAVISMLYFANLVLNVIFAFIEARANSLLPAGLLLFMLCDIFVGLSMLDGYLTVTEGSFIYKLAHPGFNAAWLFYVPAQTLLALAANKKQQKTDVL